MTEPYSADRRWEYEPRIVAIGGGTGLSTMLRGLKSYTHNLTAIVTVADDGGGSGVLRTWTWACPRRGISATAWRPLANVEPVMGGAAVLPLPQGLGQPGGPVLSAT